MKKISLINLATHRVDIYEDKTVSEMLKILSEMMEYLSCLAEDETPINKE